VNKTKNHHLKTIKWNITDYINDFHMKDRYIPVKQWYESSAWTLLWSIVWFTWDEGWV